MNAQAFPKLRPVPPSEDWIAPMLKRSGYISMVGWIVYGVFALAFDDIAIIPAWWQSFLVDLGSALIVTGAEMNTFPMVVAVGRKWGAKKGTALDAVAFLVSLVGSVTAGLIAFSIRQTRLGESAWRVMALDWGPLVVGVAIAADMYAAAVELGLLRSDYDRDIEQWLAEQGEWNEAHHIADPVTLKPAKMEDLRSVVGKMNGEWADKAAPTVAQLAEALRLEEQCEFSSKSTGERWARDVRNGKVN